MKKLLYINSCVNSEKSRTLRISTKLIETLNVDYDVMELVLENETMLPLNSTRLNERFALLGKGELSASVFDLAHQFADADCIVISAPYWDFGFPAMLKTYIENISVVGIAYKYGEKGHPVGLCKAEEVYYVTSRGGFIPDEADLGYKTIEDMAHFYGINTVKCISAQGMDIPTSDIDKAVADAIAKI